MASTRSHLVSARRHVRLGLLCVHDVTMLMFFVILSVALYVLGGLVAAAILFLQVDDRRSDYVYAATWTVLWPIRVLVMMGQLFIDHWSGSDFNGGSDDGG